MLASAAMLIASSECCSTGSPAATPVPTETPTCNMHFTSPDAGAVLAGNGPVDFAWISVSNSSYCILTFNLPGNGGQSTWNMTSTSRTLYIENFTTGGSYSAHVQARDTRADILCEANLNFSKDPKAKIEKNNGGSPAEATSAPLALMRCLNPAQPCSIIREEAAY